MTKRNRVLGWRPGFAVAAVFLVLVLTLGRAGSTLSAEAQPPPPTCMFDECGGHTTCTANDVVITRVDTYSVVDFCRYEGDTGTYYFQAEFTPNAQSRYDPGVWVALDGGNAYTGACYKDYLVAPLATSGIPAPPNPFQGPPFWDLESNGDQCGDIRASQATYRLFGPATIQCTAANLDGTVSTCVAWDNLADPNCPSNKNCPGTPSKCSCSEAIFEVNLNIVPLALLKTASAASVLPGDAFFYTIVVTNKSPTYKSTGFTVNDDLVDGLTYLSSDPNVCSVASDPTSLIPGTGQLLTCNITQDLLPGASYQFVLNVQLGPAYDGPTTVPNLACVQGNEFEMDSTKSDNCDDVNVPTAVELAAFAANAGRRQVALHWQTVSEAEVLGFNVYRATALGATKTKVNVGLIASQANPGNPVGAAYRYTDRGLRRRTTYFYWLEDVDIHGDAGLHGPIAVTTR